MEAAMEPRWDWEYRTQKNHVNGAPIPSPPRIGGHGCVQAGNNRAVAWVGNDESRLAIVTLLREEGEEIAAEWRELCRWDPMLPPESAPPIAPALISAVADALDHPQPLGWGPDPEMEKVVG